STRVVGATHPVVMEPASPATHAQQHREPVLLAVVEALVERLRRIGEFLQAVGARSHRTGALTKASDRIGRGPRIVAVATRLTARVEAIGTLLHAISTLL